MADAETRLAAALASYLVWDLLSIERVPTNAAKGTVFSFSHTSQVRAGVANLAVLGILQPLHDDGSPWEWGSLPCHYRLLMDWKSVPNFIFSNPDEAKSEVNGLFAIFVSITANDCELPTLRKPFTPLPKHQEVMDCLAETGFAQKLGDQFQWTEKSAPTMKKLSEWDEDGNCYDEMREELDRQRAHEAWETMPASIRDRLRKNPDDLMTILSVLSHFWCSQRWERPDPEKVDLTILRYPMDVARIISSKLKALDDDQ